MQLVIATSQENPHGVKDDQQLFHAIGKLGIQLAIQVWDAAVDWSEYDLCLIRSVWDYHQRSVEFMKWLNSTADHTPIINSPKVIHWNNNKYYLKELADHGINIAPTLWLSSTDPSYVSELLANLSDKKYLLKPVIGADSSGTLRFNTDSQGIELAKTHLTQWLPKVDMMLQPYIAGVETFGETSIIFFADEFSHAVRKIPVKGDYRVQDTFGAQDKSYQPKASEMALARQCQQFLKERFGRLMYARYDFLHDENGAVLLNEAELIEPSLFFNQDPKAAKKFATSIHQLMLTMAAVNQ